MSPRAFIAAVQVLIVSLAAWPFSLPALTIADYENVATVSTSASVDDVNTVNDVALTQLFPSGIDVDVQMVESTAHSLIQVGSPIDFEVTLDNVGLLPLAGVQVDSSLPFNNPLSLVQGDSNDNEILDLDETWLLRGSYLLTQIDIDQGEITHIVQVGSNESNPITASVTVLVPRSAPITVDDRVINAKRLQDISIDVLRNDTDAENDIDPRSVLLVSADTSLHRPEISTADGIWTVENNGMVRFRPDESFFGDSVTIDYVVSDLTDRQSQNANIRIEFEPLTSLYGLAWLDSDQNGRADDGELRTGGWSVRLVNSNGDTIAQQITEPDGAYRFDDLVARTYTLHVFNPSGVLIDRFDTSSQLVPGSATEFGLSMRGSGVVYDSLTRSPLGQVQVALANTAGQLLPPACLAENQQSQVTLEDGLYAFNVNHGAHSECPSTPELYQIRVTDVPGDYAQSESALLPPGRSGVGCGSATLGCAQTAVFDAGARESGCLMDARPSSGACEVGNFAFAPPDSVVSHYFLQWRLAQGDLPIKHNHLPVDQQGVAPKILLTKTANTLNASVGGVVRYTLSLNNTKSSPAPGLSINDTPPRGFRLVSDSLRLRRSGPDGVLLSDDDQVSRLAVSSAGLTALPPIALAGDERVLVTYSMRIGTQVSLGRHRNTAIVMGSRGAVSNPASGDVNIVADPVLEQTTIVGKVFVDNDADGRQDATAATGLKLFSAEAPEIVSVLDNLPARMTHRDAPVVELLSIDVPSGVSRKIHLHSREGSRISVLADGTLVESHTGLKAAGLNAQDIRVCAMFDELTEATTERGRSSTATRITLRVSNYAVQESGIAGVRLATVGGLLIQTDTYGRFHIPDVDAGSQRGRNFVLKVDADSLPSHIRLTTANPQVLRVTNSALNRMNFGIQTHTVQEDPHYLQMPECGSHHSSAYVPESSVEVSLGSVFFDSASTSIKKDQRGAFEDIIKVLRRHHGGLIVIEAHTDDQGRESDNLRLAEQRAREIHRQLTVALGEQRMGKVVILPAPQQTPERRP